MEMLLRSLSLLIMTTQEGYGITSNSKLKGVVSVYFIRAKYQLKQSS